MIRRLTFTFILSLVTVALLAPPAAQAFTVENDPSKTIPKFDFDDQLRQFRNTPQLDTSTANKKGVETPFGTLQFGVQRNTSPFSSPYGAGFGASNSGNADRRHYERMFAPPHRQHLYD
jgi:hypothetical protein